MSLFGDEADAPAARAKSSLFDDGAPSRSTGGGMFEDSEPAGASATLDQSPWGFTPKKGGGRGSLVKSLLADADVPDEYIDRFDALQTGGQIAASDARRLLAECGIGQSAQASIWELVSNRGESARLGRGEFNVLMALVGLAQEGEELGLDAVDERRRRLPIPKLLALNQAQPPSTPKARENAAQSTPTTRGNGELRPQTFGADMAESDPWGSPAMHRGHGHANGGNEHAPQRTTSTFTTNATERSVTTSSASYTGAGAGRTGQDAAWAGTNTFGSAGQEEFGAIGAGGSGGFGGDDGNQPVLQHRPNIARASRGVEEIVAVNLLEEKEGMFMFQHRNYEVSSVRRNSKVVRRYSDFVWLLDCLHKRYPFRQLPLLPPKRMQINGNHIAADSTFLEKRRRGLARFANSLVRHPVLREEQLVVMFLTVPTELAVWRKQASIEAQEEFVGRSLPPSLEDSLPPNLQDTFDTVRSGIRRGADLYITLCNIAERLCKRKEAIAGEYGRFGANLDALREISADAYAIDVNDVPLLNEGIKSTAKHMGVSQALLEDEARAWDLGVLEDLKTMRDGFVSMRDMFDRRDRLARDNIPQLEGRIQANEQKLQRIKAKGDAAKPGEAEKVENSIVNDKQSIVNQHARGVFIKECIRDELLYFQNSISRTARLHQDWAQERVKYAELQADNFRSLVDAVESMPLGD